LQPTVLWYPLAVIGLRVDMGEDDTLLWFTTTGG
jgi:hypothetical protein